MDNDIEDQLTNVVQQLNKGANKPKYRKPNLLNNIAQNSVELPSKMKSPTRDVQFINNFQDWLSMDIQNPTSKAITQHGAKVIFPDVRFLSNFTGSNQFEMNNYTGKTQRVKRNTVSREMLYESRRNWENLYNKYYACLEDREKYDPNQLVAMLAMEGQTVTLSCKLCFRPGQSFKIYDNVAWRRLRQADTSLMYLTKSKKFKITKQKELVIRDVDVQDAGQYFCIDGKEYSHTYQLDVLIRERHKIIKEFDNSDQPLNETYLEENNLHLFTTWSSWSQCSQCDNFGERRKVGVCTVQKINKRDPITPHDAKIMDHYANGVPCRSTVLPKYFARIPQIRRRMSEVIIGKCLVACPTAAPYVNVTDKQGKVIEVVEKGFYSMKEKPTFPPMVKRKVIYEEAGKNLVLKCIGKVDKGQIVNWKNKSQLLNSLTIRRRTRGRVSMDALNRLHIRKLRLTDTNPYSCWVRQRHAATIKVIVTRKFNKNIKDYISYGGFGLTIFSVLLICLCVGCSKNKKTMR